MGILISDWAAGIAGTFSKKHAPKVEGKFRNYEIELANDHYLFENPYIRKLAGEKPIVQEQNPYEALKGLANTLEGEAADITASIIVELEKAKKYAERNTEAKGKVNEFIDKYVPTIIASISSYSLEKSEVTKNNLMHTLKIMEKATSNFYKKMIETELDMTDVNQTVLEQQLMREGLYSPYDEDYFGK